MADQLPGRRRAAKDQAVLTGSRSRPSLRSGTVAVSKVTEVDRQVGRRVRMRRMMLNMSQEKLGEALGVTFQQIQKYEGGVNRIAAGRLQQICSVLDAPMGFFFEGASTGANACAPCADDSYVHLDEFLSRPEALALMRHFNRIRDREVRRKILDMVESAVAEG